MEDTRKSPRRMASGLELLGAAYVLGVIAQHLLARGGALPRPVPALAGLAGFAGVMLAGLRTSWRRFLASVFFAVPGLVWITVLSVLGTLIIQNEPAALGEKYGWFAPIVARLFWDDIFHSLGFSLLVGATAGGMGLVALRRRSPSARALGSRLAHAGVLLMLAGAALGSAFGMKGRVDLRVGQSADTFLSDAGREPTRVPLGFSVRLEDFRVEHYRPDYQLMLYATEGDRSERILALKAGANSQELAAHGVETLAWFPDYRARASIEPLPAEAPPAPGEAAAAEIYLDDERRAWLMEGRATEAVLGLVFFAQAERARAFLEKGAAGQDASPHLLLIEGRRLPVRAGDRVELSDGQHRIEVAATFLDFVMDGEKGPSERSGRPENPALELYLLDASGQRLARRFLFARHPDFHGASQDGADMKYEYLPPPAPPGGVLVGDTRRLWRLSGWRKESEAALGPGGEFEWAGAKLALSAVHPRAVERLVEETASDEENRPLLRLKIAGQAEPRDLVPGRPLRIDAGRVAVLAPHGGDTVKDYFSTLSIWEEGRLVARAVVEVNGPLSHGGFSLYQASYRPEEPDYSGLLVVKDPGLPLAYLGFALNFAGVLAALWLPRLGRRKEAAPPAEGGADHA